MRKWPKLQWTIAIASEMTWNDNFWLMQSECLHDCLWWRKTRVPIRPKPGKIYWLRAKMSTVQSKRACSLHVSGVLYVLLVYAFATDFKLTPDGRISKSSKMSSKKLHSLSTTSDKNVYKLRHWIRYGLFNQVGPMQGQLFQRLCRKRLDDEDSNFFKVASSEIHWRRR